ncbi:hypothetical protein [Acinetobacter baumannii]|uniref:hypothetical protein n=1 Tax=Acinetobacter baumannii TaxID=470 RepID=UPI000DE7159D|nr:hypothetical protein [Acinetobacter baumannii]SSS75971.1 Uncharacterised protein [Acinetobacter baumannii]
MGNLLKWLLIRKGSKIVTIDDHITDVQTVMYRWKGRIFTKEWAGEVYYDFEDVRLATRKEIKLGKKEH